MICWHNVFVGQLLYHHRDVSPWRPRRPGQRARARWEEVEEARGRKQSIFGQNRSSFCENNRQFRKLQFYQSVERRIAAINQFVTINQSISKQINMKEIIQESLKPTFSLSTPPINRFVECCHLQLKRDIGKKKNYKKRSFEMMNSPHRLFT